jgi:hypothetical protein
MITLGELAGLLGIDRTIVAWWQEKHGLPVKKKITRSKKTFMFVDAEEFWAWAKLYADKIDFSKIERNSILPEPEWVEEKRKKNLAYKKRNYKSWTTKEDSLLIQMVNTGYPKENIAKTLGRSVISVERRIPRVYETYNQHNQYYRKNQ